MGVKYKTVSISWQSVHIQIPLTSYVGLISCSTTVATPEEAAMQCSAAYPYSYSNFSSHSYTAFYETYIAGERNLDVQ